MAEFHNITGNTTNSTSTDFDCDIPEPNESFLFRAIATSFITLVALVGNGLVCRGAMRRRKRPFSYHLVTNLAVSELIFTTIQPFLFVYNSKSNTWIFGDFLCHVLDPLKMCCTLVITFTLAAIAVYRCIMMLQPYKHRPSSRVAYMVITFSWIWGIVLALPDSVTRRVIELKECNIFFCVNPPDLSRYRMTIFILNFVVPFFTMVFSYSIVICRVKKHILKTRQESVQLSECPKTQTSLKSDGNQTAQAMDMDMDMDELPRNESAAADQNSSHDKKKTKPCSKMMRLEADVLNMIYLILLVFFVCYLPYNVLFILKEVFGLSSVKSWNHYWLMVWYLDLLHMFPSALHPICYGATSKVLGLTFRCACHHTE